MGNYRKYLGLIIFIIVVWVLLFVSYSLLRPKIDNFKMVKGQVEQKQVELNAKKTKYQTVKDKIHSIKSSIAESQKKIYSPLESDLGNDTIFFTLYNDIIEMIHSNSIKIKAIDYEYNPETDVFVKAGKETYFVCDMSMELVSNYINLGKLLQDIYQYPYYIKIESLQVKPYAKDKKILLSRLHLKLYAHTAPDADASQENLDDALIKEASRN